MEIKMCECGSPMSYFEEETYGKCGACHQKEQKNLLQKQVEASRRIAEERKERERLEKEQKEAEQRAVIEHVLKNAIGKTIEDAKVEQWTDALGDEARRVTLYFTDGSSMDFSQEEIADGCRGYYDYYYYLGIDYTEKW